jgi:hypothetical protein
MDKWCYFGALRIIITLDDILFAEISLNCPKIPKSYPIF